MKVLFIGRGKQNGKLSPVLIAQADSLIDKMIDIHFFVIERGGLLGYFGAYLKLRKLIKRDHYDLYHAHYYISGIIASLGGVKPLLVSLMGSELKSGLHIRLTVKFFIRHIWVQTIVKSCAMLNGAGSDSKIQVIPNGVNMKKFRPLDKSECQKRLGFDNALKHILFISDPKRKEKNFKLAESAIRLLSDSKVDLHTIFNINQDEIPIYMSASDVLLLTSNYEGSPNVIKEAMACNLPIVSTPVGDVPEVIDGTEGCFLANFNPLDIVDKIKMSIALKRGTQERDRIIELKLDSESIAVMIIDLYNHIIMDIFR